LCEAGPRLGGDVLVSSALLNGQGASGWLRDAQDQLSGHADLTILTRTTVAGAYDGNTFVAIERVSDHHPRPLAYQPRQRAWTIRAGAVVIATGATERPITFANNDLPGVMLCDAARRHALEFGVSPGKAVCVFTNNDSAYFAARDMARAGVAIALIVDVRKSISREARSAASSAKAVLMTGSAVVQATGWHGVKAVRVVPFDAETGETRGAAQTHPADCVLLSGGWSPNIQLTGHLDGKAGWSRGLQAFVPGDLPDSWFVAGAAGGEFGLQMAFRTGIRAGASAVRHLGMVARRQERPAVEEDDFLVDPAPVLEISGKRRRGKCFVDFQHDVTTDDIRLAHREGFSSAEHLKRYTTLGMATDQGRTSTANGLAIMARERTISIADAGAPRPRPPLVPVAIGALAGELFGAVRPERLTAMHDWHVMQGARMYANGVWLRPEAYNQAGETVEQAYIREARAVRAGVGIADVSTLGKIDVQGPDALTFIERIYCNGFASLPVGKARYGLMLREDGFLFDDGTVWRLGEHHFLLTTTSANAGPVMAHLEYHLDVTGSDLDVSLVSVTDQWAGVALAGPQSRDVLAEVISELDVSNDAFGFMAVGEGQIDDIPVLVARLSFSGELAFEVYCGALHGQALWDRLLAAGAPHRICAYGLEALTTLRIEKGHVAGGDISGRVTARDLGLGAMVSANKDAVGSVLSRREALTATGRLQLVGLRSREGQPVTGGSQLVSGTASNPGQSLGHVTSACYSPQLNTYVALALLRDGRKKHGTRLHAANPLRGTHVAVEVIDPHMFDAAGERLHG
jgi:sarcosine oxidase subunit alpha